MPIYWLNIDVKFKKPMDFEDEEDDETINRKIVGYLQNIGATFPNEQELKASVQSLVDEDFDKNDVEIVYEHVGVIAPNKIKEEIYDDGDVMHNLRSEPTENGIWYRTGRGFYWDE